MSVDLDAFVQPPVSRRQRHKQSRIFEPFFTTKSVGKGSGLGLDIVWRIVENRHNGTITFESKPGKTNFTVCLPLRAT